MASSSAAGAHIISKSMRVHGLQEMAGDSESICTIKLVSGAGGNGREHDAWSRQPQRLLGVSQSILLSRI